METSVGADNPIILTHSQMDTGGVLSDMSNIFPVAIDGLMTNFCNLTNACLSYVTCFPITTLVCYLSFYILLSTYILPLNKMFSHIAADMVRDNKCITPKTACRYHKAKHKHLYQVEVRGNYKKYRLPKKQPRYGALKKTKKLSRYGWSSEYLWDPLI